jgi:hypothetical protein
VAVSDTALLTVSIGPVHAFIATARRVADQWSASRLLSKITGHGIEYVLAAGGEVLFPHVVGPEAPPGIPNRFVARVPLAGADALAAAVEAELRKEWARWVRKAADTWRRYGGRLGGQVSTDQAEGFLDVAWSWVPEEPSYAAAMAAGVERFAASRTFRPFPQTCELGQKCALCGERAALPDGRRDGMEAEWKEVYENASGGGAGAYFREGQGRLCLVCLTKRLYPWLDGKHHRTRFGDFERIGRGPLEEAGTEAAPPYYALVAMDGDHVGRLLGWGAGQVTGGDLAGFHRTLSQILTAFAGSLRSEKTARLALDALVPHLPETSHDAEAYLVYAGGEDVLFYCHPRDAVPLARAVRELYRQRMGELAPYLDEKALALLTISAGILFAHVRRPAGLSFADVRRLLDEHAKHRAGRNALALSLDKRSGRTVGTAFRWDTDEARALEELSVALRDRKLASRTTYRFADEERVLGEVFRRADGDEGELWETWLARRLSVSAEVEEGEVGSLARPLASLLSKGHPEALRLARFLGREVAS